MPFTLFGSEKEMDYNNPIAQFEHVPDKCIGIVPGRKDGTFPSKTQIRILFHKFESVDKQNDIVISKIPENGKISFVKVHHEINELSFKGLSFFDKNSKCLSRFGDTDTKWATTQVRMGKRDRIVGVKAR